MKPVEYFFKRKNWEQLLLVRDGSSVLYFLNNGGKSEQHDIDWGSVEKAIEEFDKAEIEAMTRGFVKDADATQKKDDGINPDYY